MEALSWDLDQEKIVTGEEIISRIVKKTGGVAQFAKTIDVSTALVYSYLNGHRWVTPKIALRIERKHRIRAERILYRNKAESLEKL